MRRKIKNKNIRKIYGHGNSLGITLPREIVGALKWRKGQKLVLKKRGQPASAPPSRKAPAGRGKASARQWGILIEDWG